ncbi:hypothetical protein ACJX0J_030313, partial [Zea mays]
NALLWSNNNSNNNNLHYHPFGWYTCSSGNLFVTEPHELESRPIHIDRATILILNSFFIDVICRPYARSWPELNIHLGILAFSTPPFTTTKDSSMKI